MSKELSDIKVLVQYMQGLERERDSLEKQYKAKDEMFRFYRDTIIPEFLMSLGLEEVSLDNGERVAVEVKFFGNISEARAEAAFKWLKANGEAALVKSKVDLSFGPGLEEQVEKRMVELFLAENEISHNQKDVVHPQTLKAFIKRKMEDGENFPYDLFGVYVAREVHVGK